MKTFVLLIGNIILFYAALFASLFVRLQGSVDPAFYMSHIIPFAPVLAIVLFGGYLAGVYDRSFRHTAGHIFNTLFMLFFWVGVASLLLFYLLPIFGLTPKITLLLFFIFLFLSMLLWHYYAPKLLRLSYPQALLIGGPERPMGFDIVRIIPLESPKGIILGTIRGSEIARVLIDFNAPQTHVLLPEIHTLMLSGTIFIDIAALREEQSGKVNLERVDEAWILKASQRTGHKLFLSFKRALDILMAIVLLPVLIVLLPIVALVIKLQDGGSVFVSQSRYGLNRGVFKLYKFRTMTVDDDGYWHKGDQSVITPFGAFLRKSRIDELPQLLNIIKGDISLIGPRPDMVKFGEALASKIDYYNARYIVRPGLTGWAQVTQTVIPQSIEESKERLAYDLYYIKHLSLFLELKIILKTVKLLIKKVFVSSC